MQTESVFVQNLQQLINVFFTQLSPHLSGQSYQCKSLNSQASSLVSTDKAAKVIFGNVEDILLLNTTLLSDLEARQQEQRLYVNSVGDILEAHLPKMDIYRFYCANQKSAERTLAELKATDPKISELLEVSTYFVCDNGVAPC